MSDTKAEQTTHVEMTDLSSLSGLHEVFVAQDSQSAELFVPPSVVEEQSCSSDFYSKSPETCSTSNLNLPLSPVCPSSQLTRVRSSSSSDVHVLTDASTLQPSSSSPSSSDTPLTVALLSSSASHVELPLSEISIPLSCSVHLLPYPSLSVSRDDTTIGTKLPCTFPSDIHNNHGTDHFIKDSIISNVNMSGKSSIVPTHDNCEPSLNSGMLGSGSSSTPNDDQNVFTKTVCTTENVTKHSKTSIVQATCCDSTSDDSTTILLSENTSICDTPQHPNQLTKPVVHHGSTLTNDDPECIIDRGFQAIECQLSSQYGLDNNNNSDMCNTHINQELKDSIMVDNSLQFSSGDDCGLVDSSSVSVMDLGESSCHQDNRVTGIQTETMLGSMHFQNAEETGQTMAKKRQYYCMQNEARTSSDNLTLPQLAAMTHTSSNADLPHILSCDQPGTCTSPVGDHFMMSPVDRWTSCSPAHDYLCRFCPFIGHSYTQLQIHMNQHSGLKALKCAQCDYETNDKSNFKRHKRLHLRTNPVSVLKCTQCSYTTILPKKIRDHYYHQHHDVYISQFSGSGVEQTSEDPLVLVSSPTEYDRYQFDMSSYDGPDGRNQTRHSSFSSQSLYVERQNDGNRIEGLDSIFSPNHSSNINSTHHYYPHSTIQTPMHMANPTSRVLPTVNTTHPHNIYGQVLNRPAVYGTSTPQQYSNQGQRTYQVIGELPYLAMSDRKVARLGATLDRNNPGLVRIKSEPMDFCSNTIDSIHSSANVLTSKSFVHNQPLSHAATYSYDSGQASTMHGDNHGTNDSIAITTSLLPLQALATSVATMPHVSVMTSSSSASSSAGQSREMITTDHLIHVPPIHVPPIHVPPVSSSLTVIPDYAELPSSQQLNTRHIIDHSPTPGQYRSAPVDACSNISVSLLSPEISHPFSDEIVPSAYDTSFRVTSSSSALPSVSHVHVTSSNPCLSQSQEISQTPYYSTPVGERSQNQSTHHIDTGQFPMNSSSGVLSTFSYNTCSSGTKPQCPVSAVSLTTPVTTPQMPALPCERFRQLPENASNMQSGSSIQHCTSSDTCSISSLVTQHYSSALVSIINDSLTHHSIMTGARPGITARATSAHTSHRNIAPSNNAPEGCAPHMTIVTAPHVTTMVATHPFVAGMVTDSRSFTVSDVTYTRSLPEYLVSNSIVPSVPSMQVRQFPVLHPASSGLVTSRSACMQTQKQTVSDNLLHRAGLLQHPPVTMQPLSRSGYVTPIVNHRRLLSTPSERLIHLSGRQQSLPITVTSQRSESLLGNSNSQFSYDDTLPRLSHNPVRSRLPDYSTHIPQPIFSTPHGNATLPTHNLLSGNQIAHGLHAQRDLSRLPVSISHTHSTRSSSLDVIVPDISHVKQEYPLASVVVKSEQTGQHGLAMPYSGDKQHWQALLIEAGVQCDLISMARPTGGQLRTRTSSFASESELSGEQSSASGSESRCPHCGISFDDEVLYSIHIGCHSHTDPFVCNICGKQCHNKYGFYSHLMRGHHL